MTEKLSGLESNSLAAKTTFRKPDKNSLAPPPGNSCVTEGLPYFGANFTLAKIKMW